MLHKSFKPAKCKTSLKLATSRIKLMRNKKGVQITQMKRDLAQLLESGQDRTARIRVEHVIREEKMVAAYDLVEIYCELIVARMPIIESQKTCPIDLKEAVTSVIFAAPRCSDIVELADIKKQFTAKYGKEFVSAALELRPESGVSRMLVEKLSAVAPDVQTKVKVLTGVAKEHNINWEPTVFEEKESNPPNDLLNGPTHFESASMANANPPKIHQPSNINHVDNYEKKPDPPLDFSEQNKKYVVDNVAGTSSSGITSERMETRGEGQNWNMEFKDATSAAEAAAESAERAAMAARAAAQFASHEKNPSKDKSPHVSYESSSGDRNPKIPNQKKDQREHERKDSERFHEANTKSSKSNVPKESFTEFDKKESFRKPKIINQQTDRNENERKDSERFHEANTRSRKSDVPKESFSKKESFSGDRKLKTMNNQQTDRNENEQKDSERFHEANKKSNISTTSFVESKTESMSDKKEDFESENINLYAQETYKKQPSVHSSSSGDEVDDEIVSDRLIGKRIVVGNPFAVVDERNIFDESSRTNSGVDDKRDEVVFDDDNGPKFDTGFEYDEVNLESSHIWSPKRHESIKIQTGSQSHLFSQSQSFGQRSTKSMEPSETDDRGPVSFDHSDSESESDKKSTSNLFVPEPCRKSRIELNDLVEDESSIYEEEKKQPSRQSSSILLEKHASLKKRELDEISNDTIEDKDGFKDQSNDLDLGNEFLRYPQYTKTREESSMSSSHKSLDSKVSKIQDKKASVTLSSESDSDDNNDKFPVHSSTTRPRISPSVTFFDDDDDATVSEKVSKQKQGASSVRLRTELSRRTRGGSPSVSSFKNRVDREPISHSDEIPAQHRSNARKTEEVVERKPRKESTFAPPVNHFLKTKEEAIDKVPERKSGEMGKKESGKTEKLVGENSGKKPSYVHPKLPDYDTFAARMQALRDERK